MMSDEKSGQATGTQTSKVKAMAAQEDAQEIQAQASEETSYDSGRDSPLTSYPAVLTLAEVEDLAGDLRDEDEQTKRQILKAIAILLVIKQSYEAEDLLRTITKLYNLLQKATGGLIRFLENNQAHLPIIAAMKHVPTSTPLQQIGCKFLCLCMEKCAALYDGLVLCNFHRDLVRVIHDHITDPVIQQAGMKMFSMLLHSETVCDALINDDEDEEVLELISVAIPAFRDDLEIQISAAKALELVLIDDSERQEHFMNKSMMIILEVLKASEHVDTQIHLLRVFKLLAENEKYMEELVRHNLHIFTMDLCERHPGNGDLMSETLENIHLMTGKEELQEFLVTTGFIENNLVPLLGLLRTNETVQNFGLCVLKDVGPFLFECKCSDDLSRIVVHLIFSAMFTHLDSARVQISACKLIAVMLEYNQETHKWIGENPDKKQEPIHNLCLGAMLMFRKNKKEKAVFTVACEAIYWIAADNDRLSKSLMNKNAHYAIIEGLKRFRRDCQAVIAGCRALRGLCIFNDLHKETVVMDDTFGLLVDLLKRYKDVDTVQKEVISAIACLADVDMVRYQCFVQKVPEQVVNSMRRFPDDETLQETCLEALAVLAAADAGADILLSHGASFCALNTMEAYGDNIYIIKKCLILLQMLAGEKLLQNKDICQKLATLIHKALQDFRDKSLQKEAYVAIQLLAEADKYMSELFVEEGCHEFLFEAINDSFIGTDLRDLASECFLVLCQEQNQKSKMLLSACMKGATEVVECLVDMDADVNIEEKGHTPLYHAVCNGNDFIVNVLLKKDIRELIAPLKKSLEQNTDNITGLLLRQIGYDKESGCIAWSSLDLQLVKVEWVLTTLTSPLTSSEQESGLAKSYLSTLRRSQERRHKRKSVQSLTDSTKGSRPRLRHVSSASSTENTEEKDGEVPVFSDTLEGSKTEAHSLIHGLKRSKSVGSVPYRTQSPITNIGRRPTLPTITSGSSPDDSDDFPVFMMSSDEAEEYKKTTLTGANVPYSYKDPRQEISDGSKIDISEDGDVRRSTSYGVYISQLIRLAKASSCVADFNTRNKLSTQKLLKQVIVGSPWQRKRPTTPKEQQLNGSSSLSSDDFNPENYKGRRKMSAPVVSSFLNTNTRHRRKCSLDSFTDIEDTVSKLTMEKIYSLDISENRIRCIESLSSLTLQSHFENIEKLDISSNLLQEIPDDLFKNLPKLMFFDARCNRIEVFPEGVLQCNDLMEVNLSRNKIQELTLSHFNSSVKKIDLSYNEVKHLPEGMGNYFINLEELLLNNNHLIALPDTPLGLKQLKKLDICHNQIDCIPENFLHTCHKLEHLEASFNYISHLPSDSVSEMLPRLMKLKLRRNSLATNSPFFFPKFILDLPCLRYLDLSENGISGLPVVSLWRSKVMKELIFNRNTITKLNLEGAKIWSKLEKLHLSHNSIKELPPDIGELSSLSSLDISFNKELTTLPDKLGKCSKMWELQLGGLELDLDRNLMQRRVKDIICYLHNRLKKAQRYYRMKLMVVGYGNRGKTTLLKTLMKIKRKPRSIIKKESEPTVGVDVREWRYMRYERKFSDDINKSWRGSGRSVEYTLSTWDFAGQEDFYSTHHCYLSNRAIYLVVFDLRRGVADLDHLKIWLASIHSRAPGCPVIVVGTHKDKMIVANKDDSKYEGDIRQDLKETLTEKLKDFRTTPGFPAIHGVFLVDATCENDDIDYLRNTIKHFVEEFRVRGKRVMGEKIPASYVQLSDLLAGEANSLKNSYPVIKQSRLLHIVKEAKLDLDEEELEQAVSYLHECGVLLHYKDSNLQLRDFYFIDPGWLCMMMAQVITVKQINPFITKEGILRKTHVEFLFREKHTFPLVLIPQYLKLLEKFEIALPHSDTELLIPCRLPEQRPNDLELPKNGSGKIVRIYQLPYVPIGLWFRVVSRMITLTENKAFQALLGISEPGVRKCWRKGLFMIWSQEQYFLLDPIEEPDQKEGIHIVVPATTQGSRLLGQIVDQIDNLIDEWYPGLTSIDPILGHKVLEIKIPCAHCPDFNEGYTLCHQFSLKDLQSAAEKSDNIECPKHQGYVPISQLAPDLIMSDLEPAFKLDMDEFEFEESSDKQLGDGGFGEVYIAKYKGKEVAVKVFKEIAEIHCLTMLRQEATIIRCLNHISIISLLAVGIRPPVIVLELAPLGTLGGLVKKDRLGQRLLQQKIAAQVAEGLEYLHKMMIIFRDMKPDNVLIFSTSSKACVHAKISDYGIARFSAYEGLKAQEGTLAYRAPEVIRKENYSFEADVFSYGLTMYVMLTKQHPFDELEGKGEMDRAIAEGLQFEWKGFPKWPEMHELVMQCLSHDPNKRPTASTIVKALHSPEVLSLQKLVFVSKGTTVECFAVQMDEKQRAVSLWIASGDSETYQLSKFSLLDLQEKSVGTNFMHGRIMCMQALMPHYLVIGTQRGKVWLYDTKSYTFMHSSADLQDSVLCMKHVVGEPDSGVLKEGGMLLVGLANGKVAMFPVLELLHEQNVDPICLYPGHDHEPVLCMTRMGRRVFVSCGTQLLILNSGQGIQIEKIIDTSNSRSRSTAPIYSVTVTKGAILFSRMNSPVVEIWDSTKERIRDVFSMDSLFRIPKTDARVTALACTTKNHTLWVGTHGGYIALVDFTKLEPITIVHRYVRSVRCLVHVKDYGFSKLNVVLSGGLGFRHLPGEETKKNSLFGCVAFWNPGMVNDARTWAEYEKKRREFRDKRQTHGRTS